MTTIEDVRERLTEIRPAGLNRDVLAAGLVREVTLRDGVVELQLLPGPLPEPIVNATVADVRRAVGALDGVSEVRVQVVRGPAQEAAALPGVKDIVAVFSTKGGVGKSTVAVNLACALVRRGCRVGLLDADIYGPSIPTMLGMAGRPRVGEGNKVYPHEQYGLRVMSMGFFLDDTSPVIWRGPLVTGLLRQFLKDVQWGELDVLVVDLPPGTGDAQLTLVQQVPLVGRRGGDDAAGGLGARRRARHRHVRAGERPGARHRREHERLRLPALRDARRALRQRRRGPPGARVRRAGAGAHPDRARDPCRRRRRHADRHRSAGASGRAGSTLQLAEAVLDGIESARAPAPRIVG